LLLLLCRANARQPLGYPTSFEPLSRPHYQAHSPSQQAVIARFLALLTHKQFVYGKQIEKHYTPQSNNVQNYEDVAPFHSNKCHHLLRTFQLQKYQQCLFPPQVLLLHSVLLMLNYPTLRQEQMLYIKYEHDDKFLKYRKNLFLKSSNEKKLPKFPNQNKTILQ